MQDTFRLWFVFAYALGFLFFLAQILRFRARDQVVEQRKGPLPPPPALISWFIPPAILLLGVGDLGMTWPAVRTVGVLLSVYALVAMPWATWVLGRSYAPGPAVMEDHALATTGPFRFVRHPIYSAVAALWIGAALGALNWVLLVTAPVILMALLKGAEAEERMLREKFGDAYDEYAAGRGRLVPIPSSRA